MEASSVLLHVWSKSYGLDATDECKQEWNHDWFKAAQNIIRAELLFLARIVSGMDLSGAPTKYSMSCYVTEKLNQVELKCVHQHL